jgi:hypothetical protein
LLCLISNGYFCKNQKYSHRDYAFYDLFLLNKARIKLAFSYVEYSLMPSFYDN